MNVRATSAERIDAAIATFGTGPLTESALQRHTVAPDGNERANEDQTKGSDRGAERADEKNHDFDGLLPNEY